MDEFDKIDFKIDFSDIPSSEDELKKKLSTEERKGLESSDIETLLGENESSHIISAVFNIKDTPTLTMTHRELIEAVFRSPLFVNQLTEDQKRQTGGFLDTLTPGNKKYFTRDELIIVAKNLILVISAN